MQLFLVADSVRLGFLFAPLGGPRFILPLLHSFGQLLTQILVVVEVAGIVRRRQFAIRFVGLSDEYCLLVLEEDGVREKNLASFEVWRRRQEKLNKVDKRRGSLRV